MKWTIRLAHNLQHGYKKLPKVSKVVVAYGFSSAEAQRNALSENPEFSHIISMKKLDD